MTKTTTTTIVQRLFRALVSFRIVRQKMMMMLMLMMVVKRGEKGVNNKASSSSASAITPAESPTELDNTCLAGLPLSRAGWGWRDGNFHCNLELARIVPRLPLRDSQTCPLRLEALVPCFSVPLAGVPKARFPPLSPHVSISLPPMPQVPPEFEMLVFSLP